MNKKGKKTLLSMKEAARFLGVSQGTLRRWHDEGAFLATFVSPGKHRYYSVSDLEKKTKGLFRLGWEWAASEEPIVSDSEFFCGSNDRFRARLDRMANVLAATPASATASFISSAAGEIGNNSFDHNFGNWPDIVGVFFAYDLGKRQIVLADRGVGILKTLSRVRPDLASDEDAIRVAFSDIVTGRAPEHRGNGLKYVRRALHAARADLFFQSGSATLELKKSRDDLVIKTSDAPVRGCAALISY